MLIYTVYKRCDNYADEPCCEWGHCEPDINGHDVEIANCAHCGAELIAQDGCWYHYSQLEAVERGDALGESQDYVTDK